MKNKAKLTPLILLIILAGCGGGSGTTTTTAVVTQTTVNLAGTNGDVSQYLGTWSSGCGLKLAIGTSDGADGVINTFTFTAISADTVQGTLVSRSFQSLGCVGASTQTSSNITLRYVSIVSVSGTSQSTIFTGSADNVVIGVIGSSDTGAFNLGFRDNFSKFQLTSTNQFSSSDLIYTKN